MSMKKQLKLSLFCLFFIAGANNNLSADVFSDVQKIFGYLNDLYNAFADPTNGLMAQVDKIQNNIDALKAFSLCAKISGDARKTTTMAFFCQDKAGRKGCGAGNIAKLPGGVTTMAQAPCKDISLPIGAIQNVLNFIRNQVVGMETQPGLLSTILNILSTAGVNVNDVKDVVNNKILKILNTADSLLGQIKDKVKVS